VEPGGRSTGHWQCDLKRECEIPVFSSSHLSLLPGLQGEWFVRVSAPTMMCCPLPESQTEEGTRPWSEASKTMSWNQPFPLISQLLQAFCYHNTKLTDVASIFQIPDLYSVRFCRVYSICSHPILFPFPSLCSSTCQ
jgi:hypothetical protein